MGLGFSKVFVNENDISFYVDSLQKGLSCVEGKTERGPVNKAIYISSWPKFVENFGGLLTDSDFPLLCQRALARGACLWVGRVVHHSDVTDPSSITAKYSDVKAGDVLFRAPSPGAWGDSMKVVVSVNDDNSDNFDIVVYEDDKSVTSFENYTKDQVLTIKSDYLTVEAIEAEEESIFAAGTYVLTGGSDGDALTDSDYIGDEAAGTGFHMFDEIDDASLQVSAADTTSYAVAIAGHAYCENRGDLMYVSACPKGIKPQQAVNYRKGKGIDGTGSNTAFSTSYGALYYPHIKVLDILTDDTRLINPTGDVLGAYAYNDNTGAEWFAPAGITRGKINNCLGVEYNCGATAREGEGSLLVNNQINPIVSFDDSGVVLWGNETLQQDASALREIHIRRLLLVMKKGLRKSCRINLFEPNDPQLWRSTYRMLNPYLNELKDKRAFYDYRLNCDQDAQSVDEVKINTAEGIDRGEFCVRIWIKPTRAAKWIIVDVTIMKTGTAFADVVGEVA